MKTSQIIWPVLLVVVGLICWLSCLSLQQAPQARIRVENDVTDISSRSSTASHVSYDPYFIAENSSEIFITASKPK